MTDNNNVVKIDDKVYKTSKNLSRSKKSKNKNSRNWTYLTNMKTIKKPIFLTFNTKKVFNHLKQVFIKAQIF